MLTNIYVINICTFVNSDYTEKILADYLNELRSTYEYYLLFLKFRWVNARHIQWKFWYLYTISLHIVDVRANYLYNKNKSNNKERKKKMKKEKNKEYLYIK